jgi:hypothetical protein
MANTIDPLKRVGDATMKVRSSANAGRSGIADWDSQIYRCERPLL